MRDLTRTQRRDRRVSAAAAVTTGVAVSLLAWMAADALTVPAQACPTGTVQATRGEGCVGRDVMLARQIMRERARNVVRVRAAYRLGYRRGAAAATYTPDAHVAVRLAALAHGQDHRHLLACARSEGYREAERYQPHNARPNTAGSGAVGAFQFMPSTFAGTPQGRAGLPITRIDVQAHAAAWMWSQGRRREWTGRGC